MTMENADQKKSAFLKKKARKSNKSTRHADAAVICPPDAAGRSLKMRILGYLCRIPVLFCTVAGLGTLLNSAFRLGGDGAAMEPAACCVLILSLICYGRWYLTLGGIALGGGLIAWGWQASGQSSIGDYVVGVLDVGINGVLQRLYDAGYYGYAKYMSTLTDYEQAMRDELMQGFVWLLLSLIALLFVPFLARRVRIVVPLLTTVAIIVPVFTFNLSVSNWAVTGIIAGSSAILIMWGYQRRYDRDGKSGASELFSDLRRPELPQTMRDRAERRAKAKEERAARRQQLAQRRATGMVTVEQEINEYLAPSPRNKKTPKADDADRVSAKQRRKKEQAEYLAVVRYDRVTRETRCAMGGIAGFCVMVVILLVLLLPTLSIDAPFGTIDPIEYKMQYYRQYVTAVLRGNDPVLEMYDYAEQVKNEKPHSSTAETQEFQHVLLMNLYTQFNAPVYLQGWVGVDYDEGAWHAPNQAQLYTWRQLYEADAMPSEAIFESFYDLMSPIMPQKVIDSEEDLKKKYFNFDDYGFVLYMINIKRQGGLGSQLYLPRVTSSQLGIFDYKTVTQTKLPWATYYDGVAVSSTIDRMGNGLSVEAYVQTQLNKDWYLNLSEWIAAYNASVKEIARYEASHNKKNFKPNYINTHVESKDGLYSVAQQYIEAMDAAQKAAAMEGIENASGYSDYVYDTYLDVADSLIISALAKKLYYESYADESYITEIDEETGRLVRVALKEGAKPLNFALASQRESIYAATYEQRHLLTMAVVNYLVENHEYSLEITTEGDASLDGVENFLTVTKQGYCVQFASSAALLLRELGIPARYVEGYLCSDYTRRMGTEDDVSRFSGEVRDDDKHAWIEVWYDGVGWVIYETTPPYYTGLYGRHSSTSDVIGPVKPDRDPVDPPTPEPPVEPNEPEPTPPTDGEGDIDVARLIKSVVLILLVLAVIGGLLLLIVWVIRRARRAQQAREQLAYRIINHDAEVFDTPEHRAAAAGTLVRNTLQLLTLYGSAPQNGELREEYARRLSFAYEDILGYPIEYGDESGTGQRERISRTQIGTLLEAVAAEEFGYGMADGDLVRLAEFYLTLHAARATRIRAPRRWMLRYVKREI